MPDHPIITTASGKITHIFGHRFVVQTGRNSILADVTPHGLEQIEFQIGDSVELTGEQKPTELKVARFTRDGKTTAIEHKKKHDRHHADADPRTALRVAEKAGFETLGEPRRKPKHFEVLGRRDEELTELHIELDGRIRNRKAVDRRDPKWIETLRQM